MEQDLIEQIVALNIPGVDAGVAEVLIHYPNDLKVLVSGKVPYNLGYKIGRPEAESISQNIDKFQSLNLSDIS